MCGGLERWCLREQPGLLFVPLVRSFSYLGLGRRKRSQVSCGCFLCIESQTSQYIWAQKTPATFLRTFFCVANHKRQYKVSGNARKLFAGIFEDLDCPSTTHQGRRMLACQIDLTGDAFIRRGVGIGGRGPSWLNRFVFLLYFIF